MPKGSQKRSTRDRDEFKNQQMLRSAKWNRYMLIRYLDAGVFFIGIYWAVMLAGVGAPGFIVFPALEIIAGVAVLIEALSVLHSEAEYLRWSHLVMIASALISGLELTYTLATRSCALFPFFAEPLAAAAVLGILILLKVGIVWQIQQVRDHRDKRYGIYLMQLEKAQATNRK